MTVITICAFALAFAVFLAMARIIKGPSAADRLVATELLTGLVVALVALAGWRDWGLLALDVAIGLALIGFLGSVGLAMGLPDNSDMQEKNNEPN